MSRNPDLLNAQREALISAARKLFAERGYRSTAVRDIAKAAGVPESAFRRHFETKIDIAFPFHDARLQRFRTVLADSFDAERPLHGVRLALEAMAVTYQAERAALLEEFRTVMGTQELMIRDEDLDGVFENALAESLQRSGRSTTDARILAGMIFGGVRAALFAWYSDGCRRNLQRLARPLLDALTRMEAEG